MATLHEVFDAACDAALMVFLRDDHVIVPRLDLYADPVFAGDPGRQIAEIYPSNPEGGVDWVYSLHDEVTATSSQEVTFPVGTASDVVLLMRELVRIHLARRRLASSGRELQTFREQYEPTIWQQAPVLSTTVNYTIPLSEYRSHLQPRPIVERPPYPRDEDDEGVTERVHLTPGCRVMILPKPHEGKYSTETGTVQDGDQELGVVLVSVDEEFRKPGDDGLRGVSLTEFGTEVRIIQ